MLCTSSQVCTSLHVRSFCPDFNVSYANTYSCTDGYLKSSIHRVVAPPRDQQHLDRLRVIYVVRIEDETEMVPLEESPVLRERGLLKEKILGNDGKPIKAGEWVKQRVIKNIGPGTSTEAGDNADKEVEIIKGVNVKYFD